MADQRRPRLDWTQRAKDGAWFTQTRRCILTVTPPTPEAPSKWAWEAIHGTRRKNIELGSGLERSRVEAQRRAEQAVKFMVVSEWTFLRDAGLIEKAP